MKSTLGENVVARGYEKVPGHKVSTPSWYTGSKMDNKIQVLTGFPNKKPQIPPILAQMAPITRTMEPEGVLITPLVSRYTPAGVPASTRTGLYPLVTPDGKCQGFRGHLGGYVCLSTRSDTGLFVCSTQPVFSPGLLRNPQTLLTAPAQLAPITRTMEPEGVLITPLVSRYTPAWVPAGARTGLLAAS
jgi:hypothetical protein